MARRQILIYLVIAAVAAAFVGHGFLGRSGYGVTPGAERDGPTAFTEGRPNLVAATFYSAWCSACAVLDPRLRRIAPEFEGRAVEFAKFDFSMGQPESLTEMAESLGVEQVYLSNKGATGFMALIDRRSQRVLGIVTMNQSDTEIRRAIDTAIISASAPG